MYKGMLWAAAALCAASAGAQEIGRVPETLGRGMIMTPGAPVVARPTMAAPALSLSLFRPQIVPVVKAAVQPSAAPVVAAAPPASEEDPLEAVLPPIIRDELARIAPKLTGAALSDAKAAEVLGLTGLKPIRWYHHFINDVTPVPDGICYPDNRILLSVRKGWKSYPSYEDHFRALFSHEYTHRLQNEGVITTRYGVEIPAVATELLRGIELSGLDGLRAGRIPFIGEGVLSTFDSGREWARSDRSDKSGFYFKGFMGGAAYELAKMTGRWDDAWEFLRRAASASAPEEPAAVFASILSRNGT